MQMIAALSRAAIVLVQCGTSLCGAYYSPLFACWGLYIYSLSKLDRGARHQKLGIWILSESAVRPYPYLPSKQGTFRRSYG